MAEIVKPKDLAKVLESIPEGQLANAAEELGMTTKQLSGFVNKPTSKAFQKIAETLGEGIEGAQKFVNKFIGREPTELEKVGAKAAQGGMEPPKVQPQFATEQIKPPSETGLQVTSQPGGFLATIEQPGQMTPAPSPRMSGLGQKLEERAPLQLGPAVSKKEPTVGTDVVTGAPMSVVPKKAAGLGAAAAGAATLLASAGFSQEAKAPTVIKEAGVDKPTDIAPIIQNAAQAVEPEKQNILEQQAQELAAKAQSIEDKLTQDYEKKQARLELMKLTETVMHGLVTAIGANALLNRGSPFAVDFSQGPRTDWNAEFDRLQKDYATQMGALTQKYKLESAEKRAAAAEAGRESRFQQMMEFREKGLAAKEGQKAGIVEEKAAQKRAKLEADTTGLIERISALDPAKDVNQLATARGQLYKVTKQLFTPEEQKQVEARAAELAKADESTVRNFFRSIGVVSKEKTKKEYGQLTNAYAQAVREKLFPEAEQAPAAPAAETELEAKKRRLQELLAKQKGGQ